MSVPLAGYDCGSTTDWNYDCGSTIDLPMIVTVPMAGL